MFTDICSTIHITLKVVAAVAVVQRKVKHVPKRNKTPSTENRTNAYFWNFNR